MREYIVKRGDTLWSIAREVLGDATRWQQISRLNFSSKSSRLFVGQRLRLPDYRDGIFGKGALQKPLCTTDAMQLPASLALARGFMFVVFEQLPEVGTSSVIRKTRRVPKVAVLPQDFTIMPRNPLGKMSLAEHAIGNNLPDSQLLSVSERPFGAANFNEEPLLLDVAKIEEAGGRVYSVSEVVDDLKRFAAENPRSKAQITKLISTIENIEREALVEGGAPPGSIKKLSKTHQSYVKAAEKLWDKYKNNQISRGQLEEELAGLEKIYSKARMVGRVGRVFTVIGIILTTVDMSVAARKSINQRSFRPIRDESIRQTGGWSGVLIGAKIGGRLGLMFGIETGPGAIVCGAVGTIIFGAIGYFSADWVAKNTPDLPIIPIPLLGDMIDPAPAY